MTREERRSPLLLLATPMVAAFTIVCSFFVDRGQVLESLVRPLGLGIGVAVLFQTALTVLTRRPQLAVAISLLGLVALFDVRLPILLVALWLVARELASRRRVQLDWTVVRIPVAVTAVLTVFRLTASPAFVVSDLFPTTLAPYQSESGQSVDASVPDIFLILLDGYPRTDTLSAFGYDNSWFEAALEARGFAIARDSHTNYEFTYLVLPTLLHMRHAAGIPELAAARDDRLAQRRAIREAVNAAPALPLLRDLGYDLHSAGLVGSPLSLSRVARYSDPGGVDQFERELLDATIIGGLLPQLALNSHRDRVLNTFSAAEDVAALPQETFFLGHVISPHVPFVFDRTGEMPDLPCGEHCRRYEIYYARSGMTEREFKEALSDQVDFLNHEVLRTIDSVRQASPDAAVIIFSDHGGRVELQLTQEWFNMFFATSTPGVENPFPRDARPIEILPRLLNAYFDLSLPIPEDTTYFSPDRGSLPLNLELWTGPDG